METKWRRWSLEFKPVEKGIAVPLNSTYRLVKILEVWMIETCWQFRQMWQLRPYLRRKSGLTIAIHLLDTSWIIAMHPMWGYSVFGNFRDIWTDHLLKLNWQPVYSETQFKMEAWPSNAKNNLTLSSKPRGPTAIWNPSVGICQEAFLRAGLEELNYYDYTCLPFFLPIYPSLIKHLKFKR